MERVPPTSVAEPDGGLWARLVGVVTDLGELPRRSGRGTRAVANEDAAVDCGDFDTVRDWSVGQWTAVLEERGITSKSAPVLWRLARWLVEQGGDEAARDALSRLDIESLREKLVALPGVSVLLAERLLLLAFERPVAPLDRGVTRVIARHGWLEPHAEREEWQAWFRHGCDGDAALLRRQIAALGDIARSHCKTRPACDPCPLKDLLPSNGPCEWA